jgi:hypothetical protein
MKKIIYIIGFIFISLIVSSCDMKTKCDGYKYVLIVRSTDNMYSEAICCDSFKMKGHNYVIFWADGTSNEIRSQYTITPSTN